jgi:SAM-dependent methyltransferase
MTLTETERRLAARRQLWRQALAGTDVAGKTVLDAGAGEGHCTRFLLEHEPAQITSITCIEDEVAAIVKSLGEQSRKVDFRIADLTAMPEIPSASFDLVMCDFLLASVSAYSPYREIECLAELARVLKPGGRLVMTGWEVWPRPRSRLDAAVRKLFGFRAAVHHLAGVEPFREHPHDWIERRLSDLGLPPERTTILPDVHHDFRWFGVQIRRSLEFIDPAPLRQALLVKLEELEADVVDHPAFGLGFEFGQLYAVVACKLEGGIVLGAM